MNIKTFFLFLVVFFMSGASTFAQGCYNKNRSKGIDYYNEKKYDEAIKIFQLAKSCPDKPASNDLDDQINKCKKAKEEAQKQKEQKEEEDRRRLEEQREKERREREAREAENAKSRKGYVDIRSIQFANTDSENTPINDYGSTLYASDIKYLKAKVLVNSLASSNQSVTFYVKIIKPDGTMSTGSDSPSGYTFSHSCTITSNTSTIYLPGWGSTNVGTYTAGTYGYELWYNGNKLYSTSVTLHKRAGEATYLKVDNKTAVTASFSYDGGSETFYVSTDANNWTTWGVPSWITVTDVTSSSFKLKCNANSSTSARNDYMKVKAGDKEVRIDISQTGRPGPSVQIENYWVEHNVWNGLAKGMRVHIKLTAAGMRGQTVKYCVFFYLSDNRTKLVNMFGNHISTCSTSTATYDSTTWNDWSLFIPYNVLNTAVVKPGQYSFDIEIQDASGRLLERQENVQFTMY